MKSVSSSPKTIEKDLAKDRYHLVNKVMEGLRGDAFLVARDMGFDALQKPGGLRLLVAKIKASVFPRASEEAKELFRLGQVRQGVLSRQGTESMVSYVDRRRRWWRMISGLDGTTQLSEAMRAELMIELSGITQQEALVVKAISGTPLEFEKVGKTLIEHYGAVRLRGGRPLTSGTPGGYNKGITKGQGKGKPQWRTGYYADAPEDYDHYYEESPHDHDSHYEDYSVGPHVGLFAEDHQDEEPEHYTEYVEEEIEEWEAIALNAIVDLDGNDPELDVAALGEAIQLEWAAMAAFGKAKGKGKGKAKGKGKGKSKVVRSNLTLDQRRAKLQEVKARSRCLRCGGLGHWAGDSQCKFAQAKSSAAPPKSAMIACMSDSSSDEGLVTLSPGVSPKHQHTAMMGYRVPRPKPSSARAPAPHGKAAAKASSSAGPVAVYQGPVADRPLPAPKTRSTKKKSPPNPPIQKCQQCSDFTYQGSTAYTVKKTCRDCGHSTTERRDEIYEHAFDECPHEDVDHRGSSKNNFRTFCKQCGCFIHEMPMEIRKRRVAVASRVEEVPEPTLAVVENITSPEAQNRIAYYDVQAILSLLNQNLTDAGDKTPAEMHEELDNAIMMHFAMQDPEAHPPDSDGPDDGYPDGDTGMSLAELTQPRAWMALGNVTSCPETGSVLLDLPVVDYLDPSDPNIYAALDEGCNSTCHSATWGEMCSTKLKQLFQVEFKWMSKIVSNFVGIGAQTRGVGSRQMPFGLLALDGTVVKGKCESYEIESGSTPMLLSLYAQCTLGMRKNLEDGTCTVKDSDGNRRSIQLYKCKRTGLLLVNLTEGLDKPKNSIPRPLEVSSEFKFLRQFRPETSYAMAGHSSSSSSERELLRNMMGELGPCPVDEMSGSKVIVQSAGVETTMVYGAHALDLDVRQFHDLASSEYRMHIGRFSAIVSGLIESQLGKMVEFMLEALNFVGQHGADAQVIFRCKSNRHRSVCFATVFGLVLRLSDIEFVIHHEDALAQWRTMRCGGACNKCQYHSLESLEELVKICEPLLRMIGIDDAKIRCPFGREITLYAPVLAPAATKAKVRPKPKQQPWRPNPVREVYAICGIVLEETAAAATPSFSGKHSWNSILIGETFDSWRNHSRREDRGASEDVEGDEHHPEGAERDHSTAEEAAG